MAELKKVLDFKTLLLITVNAILSTGIFFLPSLGVKIAGSASIISWAIMSIIAIYISMVFAELTSMFPKTGGVYEFCKQAYGKFISFFVGWITLIVSYITISMLVVGAVQYILPYNIPVIIIPLSLFFIIIFNYIAYKGLKISSTILIVFAVITLGTLVAVIIPNLFHFNITNLTPVFSKPINKIYLAIFFIIETFFGWETVTFLAGETKDGERIVPKALIIGTIIVSFISLLFVISSMGVINFEQFSNSLTPMHDLSILAYGSLGNYTISILVYLSILGSVASWIITSPRLILSMAQDKLFIRQFAEIHPKYFTPYKAIILQTFIISLLILIGYGTYTVLLSLLVPIAIVMYIFVMISLVVLRYKKKKIKRIYKVPFGKIGPVLVALFFISLLVIWMNSKNNINHLNMGISLILMGIPLYFLIEMYYDVKMIRFIDDLLANLALLTEKIALPLDIRKEILSLLGNIKGKVILEFGCNVGTMTMHLAEEVGPNGKIYATNLSKREVSITKKRLASFGHKHVTVLHDTRHHSRVHPKVPKIHSVISVGTLGYLQDTKKVLHEINKRLDVGAKICFVDYDKFYDVLPNIELLSNKERIIDLFDKSGFRVQVKTKQGFAWKYIFVFGKKFKNVRS